MTKPGINLKIHKRKTTFNNKTNTKTQKIAICISNKTYL